MCCDNKVVPLNAQLLPHTGPMPTLAVYDRVGRAFRRFAREHGLTYIFAETVVEARDIAPHKHSFSEYLWVQSGQLTVRTKQPYCVQAGQVVQIMKDVVHSIAFDGPTTYVYARAIDETSPDVDVLDAGIVLREALHEAECIRLASALKDKHARAIQEKNSEISHLRHELAQAKHQFVALSNLKANLKRKFDQIVDAWPEVSATK